MNSGNSSGAWWCRDRTHRAAAVLLLLLVMMRLVMLAALLCMLFGRGSGLIINSLSLRDAPSSAPDGWLRLFSPPGAFAFSRGAGGLLRFDIVKQT